LNFKGDPFRRAIIGSAALDQQGNVYASVNSCDPAQLGVWKVTQAGAMSLVRISPDGTQTVLLSAADGLDGPTSATFGTGKDSKSLYVTNAAFPFFPGPTPRAARASCAST
jgi:hypothetical protein